MLKDWMIMAMLAKVAAEPDKAPCPDLLPPDPRRPDQCATCAHYRIDLQRYTLEGVRPQYWWRQVCRMDEKHRDLRDPCPHFEREPGSD